MVGQNSCGMLVSEDWKYISGAKEPLGLKDILHHCTYL